LGATKAVASGSPHTVLPDAPARAGGTSPPTPPTPAPVQVSAVVLMHLQGTQGQGPYGTALPPSSLNFCYICHFDSLLMLIHSPFCSRDVLSGTKEQVGCVLGREWGR